MEYDYDNIVHSIHLDIDRCNGCINCLKRCPTQAIRVRDKKAFIITERCIDCGLCIRVCPHKAKRALCDSLADMKRFRYLIALPAPSIYSQFNNIDDKGIVLKALKAIGFDDVYEVTEVTGVMREIKGEYIRKNRDRLIFPIISTSCPVVTRLVKVKYPELIGNLLPVITPVELAGMLAKEKAMKETGLPEQDIGAVFITPCPAKVSEVHSPIGTDKRYVDLAVAIKDVYPLLLKQMEISRDRSARPPEAVPAVVYPSDSGIVETEGKIPGILPSKYLVADGIESIIMVLEDIESHEYGLEYVELSACSAGCFGGVLQVENPYIARLKNRNLRFPRAKGTVGIPELSKILWDKNLEYSPVMELGGSRQENFERYGKLQKLLETLPGIDCGRCGAPSCKAFAEDVVKSNAEINDCNVIFREQMENVLKMMEASFDIKNTEP